MTLSLPKRASLSEPHPTMDSRAVNAVDENTNATVRCQFAMSASDTRGIAYMINTVEHL